LRYVTAEPSLTALDPKLRDVLDRDRLQTEAMALGDRIVVMSQGQGAQVGRPGDSYFAPQSRFVAELVGTMNRLHGVVRDGHLEVMGGRVPWPGRASGEARALFRPERAAIVEPGADHLVIDPDAVLTLDR